MNIENAARDKMRKTTNVAIPLNPAAIRSVHPDHFGRRTSIRIGAVALLEQALRLAAGKLGIGIAPGRQLRVLLLTPDTTRFCEHAMAEAARAALRNDCTHELNTELLAEAATRVIVRAIPDNRRGKRCVELVEVLTKEIPADVLILHDARVFFSAPAIAVQQLRRGLGLPLQPDTCGEQSAVDGGGAMPAAETIHEPNAVLYTTEVLRKGMPENEAGPAAWLSHLASPVHLLRDAALSVAGQPGLYDSDRTHRVVVFAPLCCSHLDVQSAIASLLPHLSPPSAAWNTVAQVRWIPVATATSSRKLAEYVRAEAEACRAEVSDFIIVIWQFQEFQLTTRKAAHFLSRAILGYECVIS